MTLEKDTTPELIGALAQAMAEVFEELIEQGWSIAGLANATGVARQTVRRWQLGEIDDPRYLGLAKLFRLAGRSLDLLPLAQPLQHTAERSTGLNRQEVQAIVAEQLAATLGSQLRLEIAERRGPVSWSDDPERLQASVASVKGQLAQRKAAKAKTIRKRTG